MSRAATKHVMIMAAGTGGHIFPGLAIAQTMQERGWTVSWLGTSHGMEADLVAKHHIPMDALNFSGMRGKGWRHTLSGAVKLLGSFWRCFQLIGQRRPDVVVGMGGYVTLPGGLMARLRGIPLVLVNADAALLLSTKMLAPFADRVLFGLSTDMALNTTVKSKVRLTGNPVRSAISALPDPVTRFAGRTGPLNIVIVGGSLGARVLNETVPAALALLPEELRPVVTHQSGTQHINALRAAYAAAKVDADVVDFINDMPARYASADLLICRAGAITVSELSAAGVASILVPFMASSTTHQTNNARWMAQQHAAIYLPQQEMTPEKLAQLITTTTRADCLILAEAAYKTGQRQANKAIADVLEELQGH